MKEILQLTIVIILTENIIAQNDFYTAAVVNYNSTRINSSTPTERYFDNIKNYEKYIKEAKEKNADIIVFPECGLTTTNLPANYDDLQQYSYKLTISNVSLCDQNNDQPLNRLSCSARNNQIYLVVNLPERVDEENIIYNTNVVFDRNGAIIAKYRKYNLFIEPGFSRTEKPELITFTTDFNVTFGTFTCFDILFPQPALELLKKYETVTDIIYPTAWFSELPFLTAVQTQAGWAKANNVNLLASGYNDLKAGNGGSGIYTVDGNMNVIMPSENKSTLIIQKVPKIKKRSDANKLSTNPSTNKLIDSYSSVVTKPENMTGYATDLLTKNETSHKICHKEFCCFFKVTYIAPQKADYLYRMFVYHGERIFGVLHHDVQICGLVACSDSNVSSCGVPSASTQNPVTFLEISITGESFINNENSVFFPSISNYNLLPINKYTYNKESIANKNLQKIQISTLQRETELLAFGIYGTVKGSAINHFIFAPLLIICIITLGYFK